MAPQRILSLDFLRGMTVAGMILVNNGYYEPFAMLRHARWNGLTFCDLVFPFFLFIMGVSIYVSFSKRGFTLNRKIIAKITKRTLLLFLIGLLINWLDTVPWGEGWGLGDLRFMAVLQRIALCYFFASLFVLLFNHRFVLPAALLCLTLYSAILILGNGYSTDPDSNLLYQVDATVLGKSHLYRWPPIDPEGLLGTISSVANVLLGFYCAERFYKKTNVMGKVVSLFSNGTFLLFSGFAVSFFLPCNKMVWSPSFALITCGLCALLFAFSMKLIDFEHRRGFIIDFFQVFGVNALLLYVTSELMAITFSRIGFSEMLYEACASVFPMPEFASLAYSLTFVALNFLIGLPLLRRCIYIKL